MGRKIKFRAWIPRFEAMVVPERFDVIAFRNGEVECIQSISAGYDKGTYELMQYTGLKDKNGVEIYEGDVVECFYPQRNDITHTLLGNVAFIDGCWFITESKRNFCSPLYSEFESMEIIGNIYKHPNLLAGDSK